MTRKKEIVKSKNLGIYIEKYHTKHYNQDIEDNKKHGLIVVLVLVTVLSLTVLYTLAIAFDFFEPVKINFNTENKNKK